MIEDLKQNKDPKIDNLLSKYSASRSELEKYINEVDDLRDKVEAIFPADINFRNKFAVEEKLKTLTSFYSMLLNIRQEINKTLTSEIEIRRKIQGSDDNSNILDVRKIAAEMELLEIIDASPLRKREEPKKDGIEKPDTE